MKLAFDCVRCYQQGSQCLITLLSNPVAAALERSNLRKAPLFRRRSVALTQPADHTKSYSRTERFSRFRVKISNIIWRNPRVTLKLLQQLYGSTTAIHTEAPSVHDRRECVVKILKNQCTNENSAHEQNCFPVSAPFGSQSFSIP
jgi:hypothetical protein